MVRFIVPVVVLGLAAPAYAATQTLTGVAFDGNQRVPTATLLSVVGLHPGQKVDRAAVVHAFGLVADEYRRENVGATIQPEMITRGNTMQVVFEIKEEPGPTVQPILDYETFTGNQKIGSDKLQPALTMKQGGDVTRAMIEADLKALTGIYKVERVSALITPVVSTRPQGHVEVNFEISEGKHSPKDKKPELE
jgi:outer membrane protein insertion porin family